MDNNPWCKVKNIYLPFYSHGMLVTVNFFFAVKVRELNALIGRTRATWLKGSGDRVF